MTKLLYPDPSAEKTKVHDTIVTAGQMKANYEEGAINSAEAKMDQMFNEEEDEYLDDDAVNADYDAVDLARPQLIQSAEIITENVIAYLDRNYLDFFTEINKHKNIVQGLIFDGMCGLLENLEDQDDADREDGEEEPSELL